MKLLVNLKDKELSKYLKFTNSFIIGLKNYSVNYYEATIEEINKILEDYPDIELFISINKNIFNSDLDDLQNKLIEFSKMKIKGILFYDLSILRIVNKLNLKIDLCYHGTHMVTNYNIVDFYKKYNVKYAYLSSDITEEEMEEIINKSNLKYMAYFIGHTIISHSKRKLVSNFYKYKNKDNTNKLNILKEKNKDNKYYIIENNIGTNILTYDILNGTKAFILLKNKLDYGILDSQLIDEDVFLKILELYNRNILKDISDVKLEKEVANLIGTYEGFFFRKTIYKVK